MNNLLKPGNQQAFPLQAAFSPEWAQCLAALASPTANG